MTKRGVACLIGSGVALIVVGIAALWFIPMGKPMGLGLCALIGAGFALLLIGLAEKPFAD
jgi:hypothetical protein